MQEIEILKEISKDSKMGMDSINMVGEKVQDEKFQKLLNEQHNEYQNIFDRTQEILKQDLHKTISMEEEAVILYCLTNSHLDNIEIGSRLYSDIRNGNSSFSELSENDKKELVKFSLHLATLYNNTMYAKSNDDMFEIELCPFLERIYASIETKNWVDIESEYYQCLLEWKNYPIAQ